MADAFFLPLGGDRFDATPHTQGPWDPSHQHGGPGCALLARALERLVVDDDLFPGRIAFDYLGAIPVGPVAVTATLRRDGRRIRLGEATLTADGREVLRASAWWTRAAPGVPPLSAHARPADGASNQVAAGPWRFGFLDACEWRFVRGNLAEPGPATCWMRLRYPLVAGEEPSGLQRLAAAADSTNGIGASLPLDRWRFIPPELTVHVLRPPVGTWICVDAETTLTGGRGVASSRLFDEDGIVGLAAQALLVEPVAPG